MKKKYVKSYNEIWHERKRTIVSMLLLFAVVMVAIMGVRVIKDNIDFENLKNIFEAPQEEHKYSTMYNASRYFFRIYYPEDKWAVEGGDFGFMTDTETGEVAQMYPLVYADPVTPAPDADPSATAVIVYDKVRDPSVTARFYYREYTEEMLNAGQEPEEEPEASGDLSVNATRAPEATGATADTASSATGDLQQGSAVNTDIRLLDVCAEATYYDYVVRYTANVGEIKELKTGRYGYTFKWFTYSHTAGIGEATEAYKTDVYIVARSSNYLVITFESKCDISEGTVPAAYDKYRASFIDILNEFQLSVFDD
jgi:hypothetical protein